MLLQSSCRGPSRRLSNAPSAPTELPPMPPLAKEDPALTSYHHFSCLGPFNGTSNPAFGMLLALLPLPTSVGTFKSLCSTSNEPSSASTWPLASGIHPARRPGGADCGRWGVPHFHWFLSARSGTLSLHAIVSGVDWIDSPRMPAFRRRIPDHSQTFAIYRYVRFDSQVRLGSGYPA